MKNLNNMKTINKEKLISDLINHDLIYGTEVSNGETLILVIDPEYERLLMSFLAEHYPEVKVKKLNTHHFIVDF